MPKFLNIKVANSTLRNSKSHKDCQLKLLRQELSNKKSKCRSENNEFKVFRNEIVSILSVVDFTHLITIFNNSNDKILRKTQKKKLDNLEFFEGDREFNDTDQVIKFFFFFNLIISKSCYKPRTQLCFTT